MLGRQIYTAEPLNHKRGPFETETAVEKSKRHKLPSVDQLLAEMIQAGGNIPCPDIHCGTRT
jgi:hypothetical protein